MTARSPVVLWLVSLAALVLFAVLLVWSLRTSQSMLTLYTHASYYIILFVAVLWATRAAVLLAEKGFSLGHFLRTSWVGITLALALTALVFASVKVGFKTLSDETNLVSVSGSMARDRTVLNCTMAKFYYGNLQPLAQEVDKRPLVFPFLVSLLHNVSGYHYQNAFALNFIVLFSFLTGVYLAVRKLLDPWSAAAAMLLVLAYPVVSIFAASAGFDLLNAAFFIFVLALVYLFINSPTPAAFAFLYASLLVFANIRYESIVYLPLVLVLLTPAIKRDHLKASARLFAATPLVLLPFIWVRLLKPNAYHESAGEGPVFSFDALATNTRSFFSHLLDFDHLLPYAGLVTIAALLIIVYLLLQSARRKALIESRQRHFLVVVLACVGVSTLIYFAHFFGRYTHPSSARFFITLSLVFALCPIALRVAQPRWISGPALFAAALVCFIFYHPIAVEGRFINTLTLNRQSDACMDFIHDLNDKNILVISSRPGQYVALGSGAVDFPYANKNKGGLLNEHRRHLYSDVVVFQEIMYATDKPSADTTLDGAYVLKPVKEIQVTAESFLRISKVVVADTPR